MAGGADLSSKQGNLRGLILLSRPLNLGIAAATLLLLKFGWLSRWEPLGSVGLLPWVPFAEGVLIVVLLMMSGNWINAYFDVHEDRINRPDLALVDRTVKRRVLILAHLSVNATGLLLAIHLSWSLGSSLPLTVATLVSFLLWRYSTRWKSTPLLGNVVVASLLGMVPLWLAVLESPLTEATHRRSLWLGMAAYGGLAMGVGLVRELAKDAMDVVGDRDAGKETYAVRRGTGALRTWCLSLLMIVALAYAYGTIWMMQDERAIGLWGAPLLPWVWSVSILSRPSPDWRRLAQASLAILLAGTIQCLWIPG